MDKGHCNNSRNSKKRRHNEIEPNSTDRASKKRKIELPLFTRDCFKMNIERTVAELDDILSVMNNRDKMGHLINKFYIAANAELHSRDLWTSNHKRPFQERVDVFIDQQNNICLITDDYRKQQLLRGLQHNFESCSVEIYRNPLQSQSNHPNEIRINLKNYTFSIHRTYVLILRVSYQDFIEKYTNSFEEFVFNAAKIFEKEASEFVADQPQPKSLLHIFADFFDFDANFDPKSVISGNNYDDLFEVYRKKGVQPQPCLYSIFIILYELYDKPWIKMKEIEQCIKICWNNLETKLKYFESGIAEEIMEFVQEKGEEYDFERFIKDEKLKWQKNNQTEFEPHHVIGRYTHFYEKEVFRKYGYFYLNPFRWKYLYQAELEDLKDELTSNIKTGSISWEKMSEYDYFLDGMYQQNVVFVGESKFNLINMMKALQKYVKC